MVAELLREHSQAITNGISEGIKWRMGWVVVGTGVFGVPRFWPKSWKIQRSVFFFHQKCKIGAPQKQSFLPPPIPSPTWRPLRICCEIKICLSFPQGSKLVARNFIETAPRLQCQNFKRISAVCWSSSNGRVFIQSWRWDPPKLSRKIPSFSQKYFAKISQRWIPKPQFWYPPLRFGSQHRIPKHLFFLVFRVSTADFGFSAGRRKFSGFFPEVPVTKIRVSTPGPYKNPTVILPWSSCAFTFLRRSAILEESQPLWLHGSHWSTWKLDPYAIPAVLDDLSWSGTGQAAS